jgi:hypothetical protein
LPLVLLLLLVLAWLLVMWLPAAADVPLLLLPLRLPSSLVLCLPVLEAASPRLLLLLLREVSCPGVPDLALLLPCCCWPCALRPAGAAGAAPTGGSLSDCPLVAAAEATSRCRGRLADALQCQLLQEPNTAGLLLQLLLRHACVQLALLLHG